MGDNLKIRTLKINLAQTLNASLLPIEAKRMVVNEILLELQQMAEAKIQEEAEALAAEEAKKKEE